MRSYLARFSFFDDDTFNARDFQGRLALAKIMYVAAIS